MTHRFWRGGVLALLGVLLMCALLAGLRAKNSSSLGGVNKAEFVEARYPYRTLSPEKQRLYEVLYTGILAHKETIRLPEVYTDREYEQVYLMVMMQEPELFYVDRVYELSSVMEEAHIRYTMDSEESAHIAGLLGGAADRIISRIDPALDDWEKLRQIYDAIGEHCVYGESEHSDDAYGCLNEGTACCEGYAKAFTFTARRAGFEAMCVPGRTLRDEAHVWNCVRIGEHYYNFDLTWDGDEKFGGQVAHCCFAVPDKVFKDHIPDRSSYNPPACADDTQTYYLRRGYVLEDVNRLAAILPSWMQAQPGALTEFMCADASLEWAVRLKLQTQPFCRGYRIYWDESRQVALISPR